MTKLLFLALDGTIRRSKSGAAFINQPDDQELIEGIQQVLTHYPDYVKIGIGNQDSVASGGKSLEDAIKEQEITLDLVPQLKCIYFCPDFEGKECHYVGRYGIERSYLHIQFTPEYLAELAYLIGSFRKPNPGMLQLAMKEYQVFDSPEEITDVLMVGDSVEDAAAATAAGIGFMWAVDWLKSSN